MSPSEPNYAPLTEVGKHIIEGNSMKSEQYDRLHRELKYIKKLIANSISGTTTLQRAQVSHLQIFNIVSLLEQLLIDWENGEQALFMSRYANKMEEQIDDI